MTHLCRRLLELVSFQAQEEKVTTIPQPVHRRSSLMENLEIRNRGSAFNLPNFLRHDNGRTFY